MALSAPLPLRQLSVRAGRSLCGPGPARFRSYGVDVKLMIPVVVSALLVAVTGAVPETALVAGVPVIVSVPPLSAQVRPLGKPMILTTGAGSPRR